MAGRGKPRTPTAVLAAKGSWRAKARAAKEPKAPAVPVDMIPRQVSRKGRAYWMLFAPTLASMGILDAAAVQPLVDLCRMCAERDEASKKCETDGAVTEEGAEYDADGKKTKAGKLVESPWARIRDRLQKEINSAYQQFGMQPAARSRVEVDAGFGKPAVIADTGTDSARPLGL